MKFTCLFVCCLLAGCCGVCQKESAIPSQSFEVTTLNKATVQQYQLDPFYQKNISVEGFLIVSSPTVNDYALTEAAWIVSNMLKNRPDVFEAMSNNNIRLVVMAYNEWTTDIPEHSDLKPDYYWNRRARGLGATPERPAVSCAEENLLKYPGDPYKTENILIHEFAHAIHLMGLNYIDSTFDERLKTIWEKALEQGLWKDKYAGSNHMEYFAEGVQSWFGTNRENDHDHNHVNTRAELKEYDPDLATLIAEVFGENDWQYSTPDTRNQKGHLKGYDRTKAPTFQWPAGNEKRYEQYMKQQADRNKAKASKDNQ